MSRVSGGFDDILTEIEQSGLSLEEFACELEIPNEWIEYWVALAGLKRQELEAWSQSV